MASSSNVTNIQPWSLNETEVGFNLEKTESTLGRTEEDVWKVYIPKILPLISKGLPNESTESLPTSIFLNEKSCKPVIQKTIKTRNYVLVKRPANRSFTYKYKKHNMELEVDVLHGNIDNLRVSNNVDKSTAK